MEKKIITKEEMIERINAHMASKEIDGDEFVVWVTRIGDVLDRIKKTPLQGFQYDRPGGIPCIVLHDQRVLGLWHEMRKPIEDQNDECIDFVYSLLG